MSNNSFWRYIKSSYTIKNDNYSNRADLIEEYFKKLDKCIFFSHKNESISSTFNFKITESIPFIIKVIFEYYNKIKNNTIISNEYM